MIHSKVVHAEGAKSRFLLFEKRKQIMLTFAAEKKRWHKKNGIHFRSLTNQDVLHIFTEKRYGCVNR